MTQVITRYFDSAKKAQDAKYELIKIHRLSHRILKTFDEREGLRNALASENVEPETIQTYEQQMANGGVVMLVRAGFKPLGVAQITRNVTAKAGAAKFDGLTEEIYVKESLRRRLSILQGHPHILTHEKDPDRTNFHMADWPIPLINRRKPARNSLTGRNFHFTKFFLPLTDRRKPYTGSIVAPHARMADFPLPLISTRKPFTGSIIPRHARMANFPIRLISRRKPFNRSLIPRHGRMASVPIPLLINDKTGTNALMPGAPRMANFPIPLLSQRKPFTGSIIPRHARMASFPIRLISRRKPFTGTIVPRHGRMANFILPLIIRRENTASEKGGEGFSFSKLLGIPTLTQR